MANVKEIKVGYTPESLDISPLISVTQNWPFGLNVLVCEIVLWWEFVRNDFSATLFPGLSFALAAWRSTTAQMSFSSFALAFGRGLVYIALYIYVFALSNQLTGIAEDQIEKPNRPLVRGLCTPRGAFIRFIGVSLLFLLIGWLWGVFLWAALWVLTASAHNFLPINRHWLGKNLAMGAGVIAQLAPLWQLSAPLRMPVWIWVLTMALSAVLLIPIQDLRDMAGDRQIGRRTFPLAFGESFTRVYLAIGFTLLPVAIFLLLISPSGITPIRIFWTVFLAALNIKTTWRVLRFRSAVADHWTYLHYCYWYSFMQISAFSLL